MNVVELVRRVAKQADVSEMTAERVIYASLREIVRTVADGGLVRILGFGTFKLVKRSARKGRNPRTGATMTIPETVKATFSPGTSFRGSVLHKMHRRKMFGGPLLGAGDE